MPFTWKCSSDLSWSYASVTGDVDGVDRHRLSCLCVYVHLHLLMYFLFLFIYTLSCMHACMYACMDHACMYVCLCNVMYCTALYCTVWMYKLIINAYTYTYIYIYIIYIVKYMYPYHSRRWEPQPWGRQRTIPPGTVLDSGWALVKIFKGLGCIGSWPENPPTQWR